MADLATLSFKTREFQDWELGVGVGRVPPLPDGGRQAPPLKLARASVSLSPRQDETSNGAPGCVCWQDLLGLGKHPHIVLKPRPGGPDWLGHLWGACHVGPTCQHQFGSPRHLLCTRGCHGDGSRGACGHTCPCSYGAVATAEMSTRGTLAGHMHMALTSVPSSAGKGRMPASTLLQLHSSGVGIQEASPSFQLKKQRLREST